MFLLVCFSLDRWEGTQQNWPSNYVGESDNKVEYKEWNKLANKSTQLFHRWIAWESFPWHVLLEHTEVGQEYRARRNVLAIKEHKDWRYLSPDKMGPNMRVFATRTKTKGAMTSCSSFAPSALSLQSFFACHLTCIAVFVCTTLFLQLLFCFRDQGISNSHYSPNHSNKYSCLKDFPRPLPLETCVSNFL